MPHLIHVKLVSLQRGGNDMANLYKVHSFIAIFGWYCMNILGLFIPFIVFSLMQSPLSHSDYKSKFEEVSRWFKWKYWYRHAK